jgi:murein DD-endopeptidase MepM/ murein hydrolase activator NlpD
MQDFKSYTLERRPARGQLVKRLVIAVIFLAIIATGFLFLISEPGSEPETEPYLSPETDNRSEKDRKLIVPLSIPEQPSESSEYRPSSPLKASGFIKEAAAAEQPVVAAKPKTKLTTPNKTPKPPELPKISETPKTPETPIITQGTEAIENNEEITQEIAYKIRSGDSMASIFKKHDLSANLLHRIVHSSNTAKQLTKIKPGEMLHLAFNSKNQLLSLRLVHSKIDSLEILVSEDGFNATEHSKQVETRNAHLSGVIENSLYLSAKKAGLSEKLIMQLADIFGWDIDFALEIRSGDHFTVIFEEDYLEGEKLRDGPILAAEFVNQGRNYQALRYVDDTGRSDYYTPEGRSMRKAFLRAPVDFRRISSRFTKERWHPVLGKKRPHRGVDYAAKTGTPIKASGDGKIIYRGKKGGYGKTVIIQHGQTYTTLYGHLSRYNKKAKKGRRVKQGQVIGYVGMTGLATGPHLHYEFRVNGVHRNPLTVKLPAAQPIAKKYRDDFLMKIQPLLTKLELISRTLVANAK